MARCQQHIARHEPKERAHPWLVANNTLHDMSQRRELTHGSLRCPCRVALNQFNIVTVGG
jgi:hypothetical protein